MMNYCKKIFIFLCFCFLLSVNCSAVEDLSEEEKSITTYILNDNSTNNNYDTIYKFANDVNLETLENLSEAKVVVRMNDEKKWDINYNITYDIKGEEEHKYTSKDFSDDFKAIRENDEYIDNVRLYCITYCDSPYYNFFSYKSITDFLKSNGIDDEVTYRCMIDDKWLYVQTKNNQYIFYSNYANGYEYGWENFKIYTVENFKEGYQFRDGTTELIGVDNKNNCDFFPVKFSDYETYIPLSNILNIVTDGYKWDNEKREIQCVINGENCTLDNNFNNLLTIKYLDDNENFDWNEKSLYFSKCIDGHIYITPSSAAYLLYQADLRADYDEYSGIMRITVEKNEN